MPSQGHLVCGVRCKNEQEIRDLYKQLGVDLTGVDVSDDIELYEAANISFRDTQIDILEKITSYPRSELEKMVGTGDGCKIWEMDFRPIGDEGEIGHRYPQDYVFGVELTSRYSAVLLDVNPSKQHNEHFSGAGNGPCKISYEHLGIALELIRKKIPNAEIYTIDLFH